MENFGIEDILGIIRRRWYWPVVTVMIGLTLSVAVAYLLPPVYQSNARILVESQQIPTDLVRSTVQQSTQERVALIQQRLFTRQTMLDIAAQYRVFADRPNMSPTDIVEAMRSAASIDGNTTTRGRDRTVTGIDISFKARTPQIAAQVANEFVNRVITENTQSRTLRATGTQAFFDQEVARLSSEIEARSGEITRFKIANQGSLPDTLAARQSALSTLRERIFDREFEIAALLEQRRILGAARDAGQTSLPGDRTRAPGVTELQRLRAQLLVQRATLAETHPTIRQINARIAALEAAVASAELSEAEEAPEGNTVQGSQSAVDAEIASIDFRIGQLEQETEVNRTRAEELERSIEATPEIERTLLRLQGDLAVLQVQLREATLKRAEAEAGARLEASQQAERFEVVEQAIPVPEPVEPRRRRIIAAGTVLSGAAGFGLMLLLELLNPAIRSARDLENRMGIRPIVSIPRIRLESEYRRRRLLFRALIAAFVVLVVAGIVAVDQFYLPLPVLFDRAISVLGLNSILQSLGLEL